MGDDNKVEDYKKGLTPEQIKRNEDAFNWKDGDIQFDYIPSRDGPRPEGDIPSKPHPNTPKKIAPT